MVRMTPVDVTDRGLQEHRPPELHAGIAMSQKMVTKNPCMFGISNHQSFGLPESMSDHDPESGCIRMFVFFLSAVSKKDMVKPTYQSFLNTSKGSISKK